MPDVVGYRAKIGVIVPSTNTVGEHDFARVRPLESRSTAGVSWSRHPT